MTSESSVRRQVSVVIPTYRRPSALVECIRSVLAGTVLPGEIIVVGRVGDEGTRQALLAVEFPCVFVPIRSHWVTQPGHIPPVEAGLRVATGHIVAILDDDVTVSEPWLETILAHFADPAVGVVGGRVAIPGESPGRLKGKPGHLTWYGKTWGNVASLQGDRAVEVDTVIECNWAWRSDLVRSLRMDPLLNYDDAAMYGLDLCLQAKAAGFRVLYEPRALVLHHVKPRAPELDRANRPARVFSYCRNYTYIMLKHLPGWRKVAFLAWWFGVGEQAAGGVGALALDALSGRKRAPGETRRAFEGKLEGIRLWLQDRKPASPNQRGSRR